MNKHFSLSWIESIKYRFDGSTYYDYILEDSTYISMNESYYLIKNTSKEEKISLDLEIAINEGIESSNFIKKII